MMRKSYYVASTLVILISGVMVLAMRPESLSIEQPAVVSAVAPAYPTLAVASNTSGAVEVEVQVNAAGEVTSARSVNGHPLLRQKAENTARRWLFIAAQGASARTVTLTFVFSIVPKETAADDLTPVFIPPYRVEVRHRPFEPVVDADPPSYVRPTRQRGRRRRQ
jgi:TonB family protein